MSEACVCHSPIATTLRRPCSLETITERTGSDVTETSDVTAVMSLEADIEVSEMGTCLDLNTLLVLPRNPW